MAQFYGTIQGQSKTQATRRGSKKSGLTTHAASWQGAVRVSLFTDEETGNDWCEVSLVPWHSRGVNRLLYRGPVDNADVAATRRKIA